MILFPAVDIKGGKCVRLKKGRADQQTIFMDDPVEAAVHWQNQGARWLHIIDLDGAFSGQAVNKSLIKKLCDAVSIPVQLGGGIRSKETASDYLEAGVKRIIIGTMAIEAPEKFQELTCLFPGQVGVSLDTEGGEVKTKGWVEKTNLSIEDVLPGLVEAGAAFLIHTDIGRDGMQSGVNLDVITPLAQSSPIPILAAGGVATLEDIKALYPLSVSANLQGAISGQAIYTGTLNVREAMDWINSMEQA